MIRNCNYCLQEYDAESRYINRGQGLYCSRKCSGKANGLKKTKIKVPNTVCSFCEEPLYRSPSKMHKFNFCNKKCQDSAAELMANYRTGPAPSPKNINHKYVCINCNLRPIVKRNKSKICKECKKYLPIWEWLSGNLDASYCGSAREPKPFVKRYLIETRGDKCEVCGFDEKAPDGRSIIQMDHKDGNYLNNNLDNLQLLCPNHHAMTHNYGSLNKDSGRAHRRKKGI